MVQKDLIERAVAVELIESLGKDWGVTVWNRCTFRDIIRKVPSVDAVPVVRCGDCALWYESNAGVRRCRLTGRNTLRDDFCSRGERTEGSAHIEQPESYTHTGKGEEGST